MLSQVVTYQVGQGDNQQEVADNSRIRELLRINPPSFTGTNVTEDPENFVEVLKKNFEILHAIDAKRVELAAYQLKGIARVRFDQWKKNRAEDAPIVSWVVFESAFMFFPRELQEAKIREFLTLNPESMSVHEYSLKFTKLSRYAPEMIADMKSRMSLFVVGLSPQSSKEGKAAMLIGDLDLARVMIHIQQVEDDNLKDRKEFKNKRAKTSGNEFRAKLAQSQGCFKCGKEGHFKKECPKKRQGSGNQCNRAQSSSVAPPYRAAPRGENSGTGGGTNRLNSINNLQEKEDSPDIVTGMIQVFDLTVYALLDPGASLYFVTPCVAMNFDIIPEERVYRDCPISVNHKGTMTDLIELDMVDFDVILGMDWLHACYASVEYRIRVVKFLFPSEPVIEFNSRSTVPKGRFISYLKARKMAPAELKELKEQLKVHEKNYPTHDLELVAVIFALKYEAIIFMVFMWKCSPITRVFNKTSVIVDTLNILFMGCTPHFMEGFRVLREEKRKKRKEEKGEERSRSVKIVVDCLWISSGVIPTKVLEEQIIEFLLVELLMLGGVGASRQPAPPKRDSEVHPLGRRASQRSPAGPLKFEGWHPAPLRAPGTPVFLIRSPPFRTCSLAISTSTFEFPRLSHFGTVPLPATGVNRQQPPVPSTSSTHNSSSRQPPVPVDQQGAGSGTHSSRPLRTAGGDRQVTTISFQMAEQINQMWVWLIKVE
ncbi:hypothetical protein KY289_030215 [Solanum tuberosum]|nr:hypothetical protein KY289_030215 [Solanum tuberosum]